MSSKNKYLDLLAKEYPTIGETTTEIINLEAIMNLPKGTEHFLSDIHGEYDAFQHVLRNGSGNIKEKINEVFSERLSTKDRNTLATLIYYPEEKIKNLSETIDETQEMDEWYRLTLSRLIELCVYVASKYTSSKVRKALPVEFAYIIEELLSKDTSFPNKEDYYNEIIQSILSLDRAPQFITAISYLIQRLVVDHLHVVGDIYDRGPYPDKIIDTLMDHHSVDIQWGNHDILWMGAASGSAVCIANVLRISARYNNLEIIEDAYGISLRQLLTFAEMTYTQEVTEGFYPKIDKEEIDFFEEEIRQITKMHQAIAIIQFKLEGAIIKRQPNFKMDDRMLLDKIDYEKGTISINRKIYPLTNTYFPTIDPENPYQLTKEEESIVERLIYAFKTSERLQKHISYLYNKGSMYLTYNDNLLFHGCVPLNEDGSFMSFKIRKNTYSGKALLDKFEEVLRKGYLTRDKENKEKHLDIIWYLWTGASSSLFGKKQMTTFERYYIEDKETHEEKKNPYYNLRNDVTTCENILNEFGLDSTKGHIINGHTPVKEKRGEDPIKAEGRMIVIDGGFSKAYQHTTGLAGYTLLYNSFGMQLVSHQPFTSVKHAIEDEFDIVSTRRVVDREMERKKVRETDTGRRLTEQVKDLKILLTAYYEGEILQKIKKKP
ncbi:fructose-1,6-bisphosphatase-3 [Carnobacterium iners]|uniref:Fructose-1,6-bisphosphatase class 3 n=1 Tax=Carnobacterium iners TaxID=1073423 RepID=A0A1X7MPJ6_9LACT|nr:fructose-1,6-bisphosphatase [Carnobacterium iners]SEL30009.1 fructose-1,6-bisphosphatase-3 [Carnobacterium iners]SMH26742.1 fructose-1,6-bisphosphatase-3 [Carnobacterium iners]